MQLGKQYSQRFISSSTLLWAPSHHLRGYNSCNRCSGHCYRRRLDRDLSHVRIFPAHTLLVRTCAKHGHRITYSGNLPEHDESLVANACGLPLLYDSAMISQSIFDHGLKGNTSSVCGHKIWAQGYGYDGTTVKGASLTLTVIGYCKCTALRQLCNKDRRTDQQSRRRLRAWRPRIPWGLWSAE